MASVVYKGHNVAVISSVNGYYSIARHEGWNMTFSAVGYKSRIVPVNNKTKVRMNIKLQPDKQMLAEVTVKSKSSRYSRKNNPAVELMRRVVAAKKQTDLSLNDYYQYNKYEKITLSHNDLKPEQLEQNPFKKHPWLLEQVEVSSTTGKTSCRLALTKPYCRRFTGAIHVRRRPSSRMSLLTSTSIRTISVYCSILSYHPSATRALASTGTISRTR